MTAETESMILEHVRRMREDMSVMKEDIRVIKDRLERLERNQGELAVQYALLMTWMDGIDGRLERIERRLELKANVIASGALRAAKQSGVRGVDSGLRSLPSGRPEAGPGGRQRGASQ